MTPKTDSVAVLRECPFCGGRAKTKLPYVRCTECGAQMCFGDDVADETSAIPAWNRRHPAPPGSDAVTEEECEAAVETFASQPSGSYDEGCEARLMRAVLEQFLAARTGKGEANV